uniref:Transmembrane protein 25 n=1 Tax=Salmo trutta TaxID=8032 RepID=A0A673ZMD0_SALTR
MAVPVSFDGLSRKLLLLCAIEHDPKIDGRHRAALTLKENVTRKFNCQSEGWNPNAPPLLTCCLNGKQQRQPTDKRTPGRLVVTSVEESGLLKSDSKHNSTFSLRARKWDRKLVCAASSPHCGESYNATVTLNVQFLPEILRVNAHYSETSDPGLSLVLFALLVANTSDFLILDSRRYPWLTNHTLQVTLSSLSGNVSVNTSNSVGAAQSNLPLAGLAGYYHFYPFLTMVPNQTVLHILFPVKGGRVTRPPEHSLVWPSSAQISSSTNKIYLPRENMSLPFNMQLNDLSTLRKGKTLLLRDRYLIRTEVEVSSMVQSNYRTGNRKQSGHVGALGTGTCPGGLLHDSVPSVTLLPHHDVSLPTTGWSNHSSTGQ